MSDVPQLNLQSTPDAPPPAAAGSAGAALRSAREAAGLHIGALAVSLKVPVRKLEALESDDLEQLPDAVFARALAATVCRTLKIDPEPVLRLLPQMQTPPLQVGSQAGSPRIDVHRGVGWLPGVSRLPRPVLYITASLLLAAVLVWLVPALNVTIPESVPAADGTVIRTVPNQAAETQTAPLATVVMGGAPDGAASAAMASVLPASAAGAVAAPAASPASAASDKAVEDGAIAVFTTRSSSWVQVVDADGVVHLRKTMPGGESARVKGTPPLSVVIGRADAIDVLVRGKPFDLSPVAKDNVARFQIK